MPPTTRAAARRLAAPPLELEQLPDELLVDIGRQLLAIDLTALLRLTQSSSALRARLAPVRAAAEACRLRWAEVGNTAHYEVSGDGRTLTRVVGGFLRARCWRAQTSASASEHQ